MIYLASWIFGLCFGSFANVCISRLPAEGSLIRPASRCPSCSTPIAPYDNIPLISYLLLKGRCRNCRTRISLQYPIIEASIAFLFLINVWLANGSLFLIVLLDLLAFLAVTISVIDYHHRIIPDELSISMIPLGIILSPFNPMISGHPVWMAFLESFLAAMSGGGLMLLLAWTGEKVFKQEALGGGDIKLVAGCGALLGWKGLFGTVFFGSLLGAVAGGALLLSKKMHRRDTLPFGPFLMAGAYLSAVLPSTWLRFIFP